MPASAISEEKIQNVESHKRCFLLESGISLQLPSIAAGAVFA